MKAGKTTVIIPVGGTEQSGPHMAIGKHNTRAKALAGKIAVSLGNALVAPVLAYVPEGNIEPPTEHMGFAGTISISEDAFKNVLLGTARSFRKHGFTDIVLVGDHGGLHGMRLSHRAGHAFDGADGFAVELGQEKDAGVERLGPRSIGYHDGAGAAVTLVAALFGAFEASGIAHIVQ